MEEMVEENNEIKCPVVEEIKSVLGQKDAVFKFFDEAVAEKGNVREEGQPVN